MWLNTALWLVCTPQCGWQTAIWPWPRPFPSVRNDTYSNVGVTQLTNLWSRMSLYQLWEHPDNSHTNWGIQSCSTLLPWWYWTVTSLREDLEIRDKSEGRYCTGIRYKWNSFELIDDMVLTLATGCCKGLGKSQYEAVNCSTGMEYCI